MYTTVNEGKAQYISFSFEFFDSDLYRQFGSYDFKVYGLLRRYIGRGRKHHLRSFYTQGKLCTQLGQTFLSKQLNCSQATIHTALKHLISLGVIQIEKVAEMGKTPTIFLLGWVDDEGQEKFLIDRKIAAERKTAGKVKRKQNPISQLIEPYQPTNNTLLPSLYINIEANKEDNNTAQTENEFALAPRQEAESAEMELAWRELESANTAEPSQPRSSPLSPETPEERYLFDKLKVESEAKSRSAPRRFRTTAQRQAFRECVAYFNGATENQIDDLMIKGKADLTAIVNGLIYRMKHPDSRYGAHATPQPYIYEVML